VELFVLLALCLVLLLLQPGQVFLCLNLGSHSCCSIVKPLAIARHLPLHSGEHFSQDTTLHAFPGHGLLLILHLPGLQPQLF
jgi:hypothetical protein